MPEVVEVAERSWLDSWPCSMEAKVDHQMDKFERYEMMNRMCKDEGKKELNS